MNSHLCKQPQKEQGVQFTVHLASRKLMCSDRRGGKEKTGLTHAHTPKHRERTRKEDLWSVRMHLMSDTGPPHEFGIVVSLHHGIDVGKDEDAIAMGERFAHCNGLLLLILSEELGNIRKNNQTRPRCITGTHYPWDHQQETLHRYKHSNSQCLHLWLLLFLLLFPSGRQFGFWSGIQKGAFVAGTITKHPSSTQQLALLPQSLVLWRG